LHETSFADELVRGMFILLTGSVTSVFFGKKKLNPDEVKLCIEKAKQDFFEEQAAKYYK
jgi:hypothetical protein